MTARLRLHGPWLLALGLGIGMLWQLRHFAVDDSFITFRYVDHLARGFGPVWNIGERVEGYTSVLMALALLPFALLPAPLIAAAKTIGVVALLGMVAMLVIYVRRACVNGAVRDILSGVAVITLTTHMSLLYWSQSGLETVLFAALLMAAVLTALRQLETSADANLLLGVLFALTALTRPEGFLFVALALAFLGMGAWRRQVPAVAVFLLITGAHLLWRHAYYGDWLPNTYYAKMSDGIHPQQFSHGLGYVKPLFFAPPFLGLYGLLAFLLSWCDHARRRGSLMLLTMLSVYLIYVARVGGDWMPQGRFLVPAIPLCALLIVRAGLAHQHAIAAWQKRNAIGWVALVMFAMPLLMLKESPYPKFPIYLAAMAQHMNACWPADSLVAINMAGIIPSATPQLRYVDMLGLNDRTIARRTDIPQRPQFMPGHEKGDGRYVLARKPDYLILGDGMSVGNTIDQPIYLSEMEMAASPDFHRDYVLRRETIAVNHPDIKVTETPFVYYQRKATLGRAQGCRPGSTP